MASLNKVLLMGNLTKDPELRYTPNGSAVADFGLAINRTYTSNGEKKEETCFVDINVWGKQAESTSKYLQKGSPAFIEGRLQLDQWDDKETGKTRSRLRVVAERVQFLGSPKGGGTFEDNDAVGSNNYSGSQEYNSQPAAPQQPYQQTAAPNVPPPMPNPAPATQGFGGAYAPPPQQPQPGGAFQQQQPMGGAQASPQQPHPGNAPQMPNGAFNPSNETEDDIPF